MLYFNKVHSTFYMNVSQSLYLGSNISLTSFLFFNKCVTFVIHRGSVPPWQWTCQSDASRVSADVASHTDTTLPWTLFTCDGTMHLFVRSCGADNIFIVLINLQERYLIVGRFLFTSPLTRPRLIAPRPHFESENWMLFIILRRGCVSLLSLWRLWVRLYDLLSL